jgi:hypothetical protein
MTLNFDGNNLKEMGPPPKNALSIFIGDQFGGSGWEIMMPDGSKEKVYVTLPAEVGKITMHLPKAPDQWEKSAAEMVDEYLIKLEALAQEARKKFL